MYKHQYTLLCGRALHSHHSVSIGIIQFQAKFHMNCCTSLILFQFVTFQFHYDLILIMQSVLFAFMKSKSILYTISKPFKEFLVYTKCKPNLLLFSTMASIKWLFCPCELVSCLCSFHPSHYHVLFFFLFHVQSSMLFLP